MQSLKKILHVDDDSMTRKIIKSHLNHHNIEVDSIENFLKAMEAIEGTLPNSGLQTYDALLIDGNLSDGHYGHEIVREVKRRNYDRPIVVLSGEDYALMKEKTADLTGITYLQKPCPFKAIHKALHGHKIIEEDLMFI